MNAKTYLLLTLSLSVLFLANCSFAQEAPSGDEIQYRWKYMSEQPVTKIYSGTRNTEDIVVFSVGNTAYVLDSEGELIEEYVLGSEGAIHEFAIFDADNDGEDEILCGVGLLKIDEIDLNKAYPPPDGIPEEEELLYQTLTSSGGLYVIDDGMAERWEDVDQWVKEIYWGDVDGDGRNETVIVAGGYTNNYYKEYTDITITRKECEEVNITKRRYDLSEDECTCPGCYWDASKPACYQNYTEEECDWEEQTERGWNLSESASGNASVLVFDSRGVFRSKKSLEGLDSNFAAAQVVNLYGDIDFEAVLGVGQKIEVYGIDGAVRESYEVEYDINRLFCVDITGNGNPDYVFTYTNTSSGEYGVALANRNAKVLWSRNISGSPDAFYAKTDGVAGEVIYLIDGVMYSLDWQGDLDWSYQLTYGGGLLRNINLLYPGDLDADGLEDLLAVSGKTIYLFEVEGSFVQARAAENYYELGLEAYDRGSYSEAKEYLEKARIDYLSAGNDTGVSECDSVLSKLQEKLDSGRRSEGDAKYASALAAYSMRDYESALESIRAAREIYAEVGYSKDLAQCDSLVSMIEEKTTPETTATTLRSTTLPVATTQPGPVIPPVISDNILMFAVAIGFVLVFFVFSRVFSGRKKAPEGKAGVYGLGEKGGKKEVSVKLGSGGDEHDLKDEWENIEGHWNKLDDIK